jgi:hypothetical protein
MSIAMEQAPAALSLFDGFEPDEAADILGTLETRVFPAGAVVIEEGELPRRLYRERPFGGVPVIPMKLHLTMDAVGGAAVGLSPWLTGTWRKGWQYWAPQTFAMTSELFFALTTETDT